MSVLGGASAIESASGYQIANSLRLRSSASAYLSRTPGVAGNRKTWTWSGWIKRGALGVQQQLITAANVGANLYFYVRFLANDTLEVFDYNATGGSFLWQLGTTQVFRDPSAWLHIVIAVDTTQATAANRVKLYINGSQVSAFAVANYPSLNFDTQYNFNGTHYLGSYLGSTTFQDGYRAEEHSIDGQALTPSSFGQTDTNGVWVPKAYSGTYGTNGFYLKFNDGSSTTNLCLDRSGNGNNWTATNVSLAANGTYDWMVDTPTNNYCTLNSIQSFASLTSSANLTIYYANTSTWATAASTYAVSSGKWYWETTHSNIVHTTSETLVGILANTSITASLIGNTHVGLQANGYGYYSADGQKWSNGAGAAYGSALTNGDVLGIALDADAGTITFYKNNTSLGTAYSGLTGPYMPAVSSRSGVVESNFGQRPFTYTPPTGFKALCTANLPAVTIANGKKHFDVVTRAGTSATVNITSLSFQPDLAWSKKRSGGVAYDHYLTDSVRGAGLSLYSSLTSAESSTPNAVNAFGATGYTIGNQIAINESGHTFVDWLWKANGAGVTNTSGSITSTVSANTTAGFSIVTYTGTGANATVGHGLGTVPKLVIVKSRSASLSWMILHASLGATRYLSFDTSAFATNSTAWNNTDPTSSVFSLGTGTLGNVSTGSFLAYCFAEVPGFSKFGSYTGNGSADGPFVYCGFRPRWVMIKRIDVVNDWVVMDTSRLGYNQTNTYLVPNTSGAEATDSGAGSRALDILSNGFKNRDTSAAMNASGGTHIFVAFAENPFGGSNTAPATAR